MNDLERYRVRRRQVEVEIKRLEDKISGLKDEKADLDQRIRVIQNELAQPIKEFKPTLFG